MTAHSLAHLRELLAKATPGPWRSEWNDDTDMVYIWAAGHSHETGGTVADLYNDSFDQANAALIAAAVNALPGLLARLELAERVVAAARAVYEHDDVFCVACEETHYRDHQMGLALAAYDDAGPT
jgi:hypothetical protein